MIREQRSMGLTMRVGCDGAMQRAPHTGSGQYSAALLAALRALPEIAVILIVPDPIPNEPDALIARPPAVLRSARIRKVWWEQIGIRRAARAAVVDLVHIPYFAAPVRQTVPF